VYTFTITQSIGYYTSLSRASTTGWIRNSHSFVAATGLSPGELTSSVHEHNDERNRNWTWGNDTNRTKCRKPVGVGTMRVSNSSCSRGSNGLGIQQWQTK
jgi:hypothetical protein